MTPRTSARTSDWLRMNRRPSLNSSHAPGALSSAWWPRGFWSMPSIRLTNQAERKNVRAFSQIAIAAGRRARNVQSPNNVRLRLTTAAYTNPPIGSVPYAASRFIWLAWTRCPSGTRFGTIASFTGMNSVAMVSMTSVARNSAHTSFAKGTSAITTPRPMSVAMSRRRRFHRSAKTPATGPSTIVGRTRAIITPDRANAAARVGPRIDFRQRQDRDQADPVPERGRERRVEEVAKRRAQHRAPLRGVPEAELLRGHGVARLVHLAKGNARRPAPSGAATGCDAYTNTFTSVMQRCHPAVAAPAETSFLLGRR
jgi:hypothetical protein